MVDTFECIKRWCHSDCLEFSPFDFHDHLEKAVIEDGANSLKTVEAQPVAPAHPNTSQLNLTSREEESKTQVEQTYNHFQ